MVKFECFCDDCKKTVPVKRVKITKTGFMLIFLECSHTTGFGFDAKLVPMIQQEKG